MDEIGNEGRFRIRNGGKRPDHKRQLDRGIQYRRTATANAERRTKVIVAGIGMLLVVRSILVFDAKKMVGYFHNSTTSVAAGHERQCEHIDGEYVDGYLHSDAKVMAKNVEYQKFAVEQDEKEFCRIKIGYNFFASSNIYRNIAINK